MSWYDRIQLSHFSIAPRSDRLCIDPNRDRTTQSRSFWQNRCPAEIQDFSPLEVIEEG
jgi:hypothetical protein